MKEWTIDTEETQKYLERYSENRYLVESRGYNKDTFMEEIWIFVNEIIDKRLDKDEEMSMSEIYNTSHLFRVDHYLICVYTSAKDEELTEQLKNIYFSTRFSAKGEGLLIEKAFFEFYKKIDKVSPEFIKKSQEIIDKLDDPPNDLYEYADEQSGYLNDEMFYQAKDLSEKIQQFIFELRAYMIDRIKDRKK